MMSGCNYVLIDLGALSGGKESGACSVNDAGQVVGWYDHGNGVTNAFLYTDGKLKDITPPGKSLERSGRHPLVINSGGKVCGTVTDAGAKNSKKSGFLWIPDVPNGPAGTFRIIDPPKKATAIYFSDMNNNKRHADHELVVGRIDFSPGHGSSRILGYKDKKLIDLGQVGNAASQAIAVNASEELLVEAGSGASYGLYICKYENGSLKTQTKLMKRSGQALSINNAKPTRSLILPEGSSIPHVVQTIEAPVAGEFKILSTAPLMPNPPAGLYETYQINDLGEVVGSMYRNNLPLFSTSYRWDPVLGNTIDLNTLLYPNTGWELDRAISLNNKGFIVGEGNLRGGTERRAFLLKPNVDPDIRKRLTAVEALKTITGIVGDNSGKFMPLKGGAFQLESDGGSMSTLDPVLQNMLLSLAVSELAILATSEKAQRELNKASVNLVGISLQELKSTLKKK